MIIPYMAPSSQKYVPYMITQSLNYTIYHTYQSQNDYSITADRPRAQGVAFIEGSDMAQAVEKFNGFKPVFRGEGESGQEAELMELIRAYEMPDRA